MKAARMPNDLRRASLPLSTAWTALSVAEAPLVVLNSVFSKGGPNSQIASVLEATHVPPSLHFVAPMRHDASGHPFAHMHPTSHLPRCVHSLFTPFPGLRKPTPSDAPLARGRILARSLISKPAPGCLFPVSTMHSGPACVRRSLPPGLPAS